jgi:hypothetical protein
MGKEGQTTFDLHGWLTSSENAKIMNRLLLLRLYDETIGT